MNFDIWSVISSISTAGGVIVALGLATVPSLLEKNRVRANSKRRIHVLIVESMILLRNYFNYCPPKYKSADRVKYWVDTDIETLVDIRATIDEIDKLSSDLSSHEARLLSELTSNMRNIFSGWAVKQDKWIETYQQGRRALSRIFRLGLWDIEFQENIIYPIDQKLSSESDASNSLKNEGSVSFWKNSIFYLGVAWIASTICIVLFPSDDTVYWIETVFYLIATCILLVQLVRDLGDSESKNSRLYQLAFILLPLALPYMNIFRVSSVDITVQTYISAGIVSIALVIISFFFSSFLWKSIRRIKIWNAILIGMSTISTLIFHYLSDDFKERAWIAFLPIAVILVIQKICIEVVDYRKNLEE